MTTATGLTYFLYAGRLFHDAALPALAAERRRRTEASGEPPASSRDAGAPPPSQPRTEDPGPEGPEGEPVGEDDEAPGDERNDVERKPSPGPGMPMVPEHGAPDANPIDPRVF
ncbi:MAG: hypothetical protein KF850_07490 [Labilithrix sp.]|nr:hypothetical protein [Labilithrix sp.]